MVRAPVKSCPSLSRVFDNADQASILSFLNAAAFQRLDWLADYKAAQIDAKEMLIAEKKTRLGPLETEAARILAMSDDRGHFALDAIAKEKLEPEQYGLFLRQRDELTRSIWTYLNLVSLFEAAENSLHLRMYRRYDKHYQTFKADPSVNGGPDADSEVLKKLLEELGQHLDRGKGYSIDKFDIPAEGDQPAAEMYMLFHPAPATSVRELDDDGNRTRIYFRPPGEAMIVYTPSTGMVHVRAGTRALRHKVADLFVSVALQQPVSRQPVDFQAYDISQFRNGFDLPVPQFEDVTILHAQVIRAEVSVGKLSNRLSLSTIIDESFSGLMEEQSGLAEIFKRAVAIRFVEIAARYQRSERPEPAVLNFSISDRNTSSLHSLDDPFERVLGHRLLQSWGIMSEGRPPSDGDKMQTLPALLAIWDIGTDKIGNAWLLERDIQSGPLEELGFLIPAGWEGDDVIDDEDDVGPVSVEVRPRPESVELRLVAGQSSPANSLETYKMFDVRKGWVAQYLQMILPSVLDVTDVKELDSHLLRLGFFNIEGRPVPVYLARKSYDETVRDRIDTLLRSMSGLGAGLVLNAGTSIAKCIAMNVLSSMPEHFEGNPPDFSKISEKLKSAFLGNRNFALGGSTVELIRSGESGQLRVPGRGSIDIVGENRLEIIQRLVDAHNRGATPIKTSELHKGYEDQSLSNIFGSVLWAKLKKDFVKSPRKSLWEIAI
jgi:hypothetical protein